MIDSFEVISSTGVVLWSKAYSKVPIGLLDSFITDVFIERKTGVTGQGNAETVSPSPSYDSHGYTVRWATAKQAGIIFAAVHQSRIHIAWLDQLLANVRTLFTEKFKDELLPGRMNTTTVFDCPFDSFFDIQIARLEPGLSRPAHLAVPEPAFGSQAGSSVETDEDETGERSDPSAPASRPASSTSLALKTLPPALNGPTERKSRRARKAAASAAATPSIGSRNPSTSEKPKAGKKSGKQMRKWTDGGLEGHDDPDLVLDYSKPSRVSAATAANPSPPKTEAGSADLGGRRTTQGEFLIQDLEETDSILASASANRKTESNDEDKGAIGSGISAIGSIFRNFVGGKTLTKLELDKALRKVEEQLIKKNVAREAAARLCDVVEQELVGLKTASFTSVDATLNRAMEQALHKMLTPTTSLDLLREVNSVVNPPAGPSNPYVISIVGVNGVGKSTNLSKLAYFFLQNHFRVLVVAGDTFRSGAVEQLGVHVRNLKELVARDISSSSANIELYQRGYGVNAATVASKAVEHARTDGWQIVLIDTAGRRHNDSRLMSNLDQFATAARPHKIFMVGEALVGSDSVMQARNFDDAFSKGASSAKGGGRHLDGFIISKCDTVGDMVGVLVSMVHATGVPIVFLGVGQHYTDLRTLSVPWAVRMLMQ